MHLAAKHFVENITPLPRNAGDTSGGDPASDDDCDEDDEDVDSGDSLGKAIAFVKQVRVSSTY